MFQDRQLLIATKHDKQRVIAPILEQELGVVCVVAEGLDTDELGTFTGEIARTLDPVAAAREKCRRAMARTGCDLCVASEGSFGPHPASFFVPADDELLVFVDARHNLEVVVRELSLDTNFSGQKIATAAELQAFAGQAGFPGHGLILRKSRDESTDIFKDITDEAALQQAFAYLLGKYGHAYAETDMRAHRNPTRMRVIEAATRKLAAQLKSECPGCHMPGFGVTEARKGLPCSWCSQPTNAVLSFVYQCRHCGYQREERYPHNKTTEDPMYCDHCNP
ncbi:DUF6671 family protein [Hymenobacter latericus]|uniref:DUF6671 family protein n=1 Tax=Hymenobacter sp. YIM 151858-1 TaxID=2987688 RepID=UPI002225D448|nr:DUF6671 family protein [Hymenobacter sp. YIM 151858-1]UYZ60001.1 hypothetical protein OIS50_04195 [Hymenobacter sp. YIM 151858-1]